MSGGDQFIATRMQNHLFYVLSGVHSQPEQEEVWEKWGVKVRESERVELKVIAETQWQSIVKRGWNVRVCEVRVNCNANSIIISQIIAHTRVIFVGAFMVWLHKRD